METIIGEYPYKGSIPPFPTEHQTDETAEDTVDGQNPALPIIRNIP